MQVSQQHCTLRHGGGFVSFCFFLCFFVSKKQTNQTKLHKHKKKQTKSSQELHSKHLTSRTQVLGQSCTKFHPPPMSFSSFADDTGFQLSRLPNFLQNGNALGGGGFVSAPGGWPALVGTRAPVYLLGYSAVRRSFDRLLGESAWEACTFVFGARMTQAARPCSAPPGPEP